MFKKIFFSYIQRLKRDDLSTYSAQIAYYSMLSLVPLMLILSLLMNYFGLLNLEGLVNLIIESAHLNTQTAQILRSLISGVDGSLPLFSISTVTIVWASSRMIRAIMKGIHMAYREQDNHTLIIRYLISILYTLLLCIVLFLAMVGFLYGNSILALFSSLGLKTTLVDILWKLGSFILPTGFGFLVFWTMYRLIPTRKVTLRDCLPGALLSTLLVIIFSFVFSLFVRITGNFSLLYGSLSNVIMILMWFLFFGYALLLGMELNGVLYEDAEYQLFVTELRAKLKENAAIRKEKRKEKRAQKKEERLQKKEDKARFREAAKVLAAQMAEEDARKKEEEAALAAETAASEEITVSSDVIEVHEDEVTEESLEPEKSPEALQAAQDMNDTVNIPSAETNESTVTSKDLNSDESHGEIGSDEDAVTESAEENAGSDGDSVSTEENSPSEDCGEETDLEKSPEALQAAQDVNDMVNIPSSEAIESTESSKDLNSEESEIAAYSSSPEEKTSDTPSEEKGRGRGRRRNRRRH